MGIQAVARPIEIIRKNTKQRISITVVNNDTGDQVDATELSIDIVRGDDSVLYSEDFFAAPLRIIKPVNTVGEYYIVWGDGGQVIPNPTNETDSPGDILFNWRVVADAGTEEVNITQVAKIVSSSTLGLLPYFQTLIDKAVKLVDRPQEVFLGFSTDQLIQYLEGGLQMINQYQPYGFFTFETFPIVMFREILLESALVVGAMSQTLFAIDCDVKSYSDQGESFGWDHQGPLSQFLNFLTNKLEKSIPAFKLHFINSGSVKTEIGPSFRLNQVLSSAINGALFRNTFFRGP